MRGCETRRRCREADLPCDTSRAGERCGDGWPLPSCCSLRDARFNARQPLILSEPCTNSALLSTADLLAPLTRPDVSQMHLFPRSNGFAVGINDNTHNNHYQNQNADHTRRARLATVAGRLSRYRPSMPLQPWAVLVNNHLRHSLSARGRSTPISANTQPVRRPQSHRPRFRSSWNVSCPPCKPISTAVHPSLTIKR